MFETPFCSHTHTDIPYCPTHWWTKRLVDRPTDRPDQLTDRPTDRPDQLTDRPTDRPDQLTDRPTDRPDQLTDRPTDKPDQLTDRPTDRPDQLTDGPSGGPKSANHCKIQVTLHVTVTSRFMEKRIVGGWQGGGGWVSTRPELTLCG